MSKFTGPASVFSSNPLVVDEASPSHDLGAKLVTPDGRAFRYARAGSGAALVVGNLLQAEAEDTGEQNLAVSATAIGATQITTTTTVTVTANEYAGGFVVVAITPGLGQTLKIKSHPAATAAALTLDLEDPVQTALTTDSRIDLVPSLYAGVIQNPTSITGSVVGVACNNIAASNYGWIQTGGPAACLADGTLTVGLPVVASNGTAGGVETISDGANELLAIVGIAMTAATTAEAGLVNLTLDR